MWKNAKWNCIVISVKESCLILLQTIPDTINIDSLRSQLVQHFPGIINVHDLHIWQLTATKVISTAHIIFETPKVRIYRRGFRLYLSTLFVKNVLYWPWKHWNRDTSNFQLFQVYNDITNSLTDFFLEHGITQVTIQPEFFTKSTSNFNSTTSLPCLMQCQSEGCRTSHCCPTDTTKVSYL